MLLLEELLELELVTPLEHRPAPPQLRRRQRTNKIAAAFTTFDSVFNVELVELEELELEEPELEELDLLEDAAPLPGPPPAGKKTREDKKLTPMCINFILKNPADDKGSVIVLVTSPAEQSSVTGFAAIMAPKPPSRL